MGGGRVGVGLRARASCSSSIPLSCLSKSVSFTTPTPTPNPPPPRPDPLPSGGDRHLHRNLWQRVLRLGPGPRRGRRRHALYPRPIPGSQHRKQLLRPGILWGVRGGPRGRLWAVGGALAHDAAAQRACALAAAKGTGHYAPGGHARDGNDARIFYILPISCLTLTLTLTDARIFYILPISVNLPMLFFKILFMMLLPASGSASPQYACMHVLIGRRFDARMSMVIAHTYIPDAVRYDHAHAGIKSPANQYMHTCILRRSTTACGQQHSGAFYITSHLYHIYSA